MQIYSQFVPTRTICCQLLT